jgi:Protein of unknown function (DUF3455)
MFKLTLAALIPLALVACSSTATLHAPEAPAKLAVPAGNKLALVLHASGAQVYTCAAKKDDATQFEWALKAPDAKLSDASGAAAGKHYAGPTWEAKDGSKVIGKKEQSVDAPGAGDIPWLLLSAKSNEGAGVFGKVTFVQRLETHGGKAPATGADAAHAGQELRVDYKATYCFYVAAH